MQLCPNCVIELVKESKRFGDYTIWFVCPKCGHRERPESANSQAAALERFTDRIKRRNKNINQFNYDV